MSSADANRRERSPVLNPGGTQGSTGILLMRLSETLRKPRTPSTAEVVRVVTGEHERGVVAQIDGDNRCGLVALRDEVVGDLRRRHRRNRCPASATHIRQGNTKQAVQRKCQLTASKSAWTCGRANTTSPHAHGALRHLGRNTPGGRLSPGPDQKSSTVSSRGISHSVSGSPQTKCAPITLGHGHGRNGQKMSFVPAL
jgi:hypothetical protein